MLLLDGVHLVQDALAAGIVIEHAAIDVGAAERTDVARLVKALHAKVLGPKSSAFVAAGDITLEDAVKLAEKHFETLAPLGRTEVVEPRGLDRRARQGPARPGQSTGVASMKSATIPPSTSPRSSCRK